MAKERYRLAQSEPRQSIGEWLASRPGSLITRFRYNRRQGCAHRFERFAEELS
jgi:hypothetical protein